MKRRAFLACGATALMATAAGNVRDSIAADIPSHGSGEILLNPRPLFDLSPYLYQQFMEPLGKTDGSVAAAWDDDAYRWRSDLVSVTKELGPTLMRWGGCFSS